MKDQKDDRVDQNSAHEDNVSSSRRGFLKKSAALGAGGAILGAPAIGNAQDSNGIRLRIQSSWQPGTVGYKTFENWAKRVQELTHGEVRIEPHPAGSIVGDFSLVDGVRDGVIEGQNMFTVYWAGKMPAGVFFSSYPMALSVPHHWDIMYGAYGGHGFVNDLYGKFGMEFLGHVHHDMNLIHSKEPLRSFDDFKGKKIRFPGGIVAETFASVGVRTTLLPGSEVYPALEKGTIDAADFVGPAVNYELGFHQVTDYIIMGPTSTPCLHQPVDLMDIAINKRTWNRLSSQTQDVMRDLVAAYSREHYAAIQEANRKAWPKYEEAGVEVIHLSEEDAARFRQAAIPKWFEWANKDEDAARLFKIHLETMKDPSIAVITDEDVKDYSLDI
ncbi:TRAP transporter substrate-binding protein DctP [Halofilum ochraceum]|uniref:TRAP transporter substrate-binding protein DctP n=1 Tax=Halofilum ochraceum TaxID=1611323 RepID=UPI0008DAF13F|nr:TRAP transporter substrate-binding protein DctP [Halofilum ochraceum]